MAQQDIDIVIKAEDKASRTFESISDKVKGFGVAFTAAGAAITTAMGFAIKAASDAQVQMQGVDTILNAMKDSGKIAADGLKGYREQIVKAGEAALKFGFDDEAAALSVTKLFQRTNDLNQAISLNRLAMDLARSKHIDLATAGNLVGMVMSGNARVLKQYGIDIKDAASPTEALAELQVKLKGTAEDYAQTFAGQSDVLKEKLGNIVETVGAKLLPILTQLAENIAPIADKIIDWMGKHEKLTQAIVIGVAALGGLMAILGPLLLILPALVTGMQLVGSALIFLSANPIVLIIAAVVALIAVIIFMITHWQKTKEVAVSVWNSIREIVGGAMETVKNYVSAGMSYVSTVWQQTWQAMKDYVMGIWNEIVNKINGFIDGIVNKINGLINSISSVGSAIGNKVSGAYNSVSGFVSGQRAAGGYVASGRSYLVGEQGPEIFTPNGSGYITPNGAIGARPIAVYITGNNISSAMDLNLIADQVGRAIVNKLKLNQKMNI